MLLIIGDDDLVIVVCRLGGFVAFVVYMTTIYGLYVPDWSFVVHDGDSTERYTVCNAYSRFELHEFG